MGKAEKKEKKAARKSRRRGRKLSRYRQRNEKVSVSLLVAFAVTRRRYEERQIRKKKVRIGSFGEVFSLHNQRSSHKLAISIDLSHPDGGIMQIEALAVFAFASSPTR